MLELVLRFLISGVAVSAFAVIGDLFKPKSFGGLFGAAPSLALATLALATLALTTLALTIAKDGRSYAATEACSMLAGAAALVSRPVWFAFAFFCWLTLLR